MRFGPIYSTCNSPTGMTPPISGTSVGLRSLPRSTAPSFFEYAVGGKAAFRRAALWTLSRSTSAEPYHVPDISNVALEGELWGGFLRVASTWGPQEDYYRDAQQAWPTGYVDGDELWDVLCELNNELFQAALKEVGLDLTRPNPSNSLERVTMLTPLLEIEIIPARELDQDAPSLLVQTDEFASRILLSASLNVFKQYAVSNVERRWDISGDRLRRSFYNGAEVPLAKVESLNFVASRSGGAVMTNEHGGLDLTWPIWPQDAGLLQ